LLFRTGARGLPRSTTAAKASRSGDTVLLGTYRLSCLCFGPLLQSSFARKLYAPFVVNPDAFHPNHVANLRHILRSLHSKIGQLRNVDQPILTWKHFHKRAEFLSRNDTALI